MSVQFRNTIEGVHMNVFLLRVTGALLALAAGPALADEALACDNKRIVSQLNNGYSNPEGVAKTRIDAPREVGHGLPPAQARVAFEKSRYCEANVVLANGGTDTIYYRLNVMKGGKAQDHVEPCFKKLNAKSMLADGCVDHRPAK
jgi:hypothetical protein